MSNLRDRDGVWHTDLYVFDPIKREHVRIQRSTRVKNDGTRASKQAALIEANKLQLALSASGGVPKGRVSLREAFEKRLEERELEGAPEASLNIILEKAVHTLGFFGETRNIAQFPITADELKAYAKSARSERAIGTVQRELQELRCAIRAAGFEPPDAPQLGKAPAKEIWLDEPSSKLVLAKLAPSKHDHFLVYRLAGLRWVELYKLTKHDLLQDGYVRVRGTKTKKTSEGGADRTMQVHPVVWEILQARARLCEQLFPDKWTTGSGNRDLTGAARRAGVLFNGQPIKLSFNVLRASYCTDLVLAGVPLKKVAYLMGHKTTHMVELVYTRFFGNQLGVNIAESLKW